MVGVRIFAHAIWMVFSNLGAAVRITGIAYILWLVPFILMHLLLQGLENVEWVFLTLVFLVQLFLFIWIAVAWHRYVLLGELPKWPLPPFRRDGFLAYLLQLVILSVIGLAATIVFLVALFVVGLITLQTPAITIVVTLIFACAALVVSQRLSVVLPGSAVGRDLSLDAAWDATQSSNWAIIVITILSAIAAVVVDLPVELFEAMPMLQILWLVLTGWIKILVGITILTTLYGHYVEGRPIGRSGTTPQTTS